MYTCNGFLCLCSCNCLVSSFLNSFALQSGDLNNFTAKCIGKCLDINLVAALSDYIHHVDSHNNRDAKLDDLCRQIQVTLQVRTINDIDDCVWMLTDQIISCYNFLQCIWRKRINTR